MLKNSSILITGGTGSFGNAFVPMTLKKYNPKRLVVFSRDEMKQWDMKNNFTDPRIQFVIGDVRDVHRLEEVSKNVDILIHAAATKIVPTAEENPSECIKTNIMGALNVINASKKNNIKKVIALSTDKACNPINIYGATKLTSDKLFVSSNEYERNKSTRCSVVRYGNVMNSRGSVIPFFLSLKNNSKIPITDLNMTRFMISLDDAVNMVLLSIKKMSGGEIFVKKIPSMKITDIAKAIHEKSEINLIGIRPGEKIHEQMISSNDARYTVEFKDFFKILPDIKNNKVLKTMSKGGKKVELDFVYSSDKNSEWLKVSELRKIIKNF